MLAAHRSKTDAAPHSRRFALTVEHLAYLGLGALTMLLHFWLLGNRALHHDETIHAYYSWRLYRGEGYVHDPLTHGPFLYYWTALQYFLFGDTDFTARLSAAGFGVALTLLPWLLRKDIGSRAALFATGYMVLSPVALYVGRFIRHDIFAVTFELLCLISILRYVATRRPGWLYLFAASLALMYCTIETSYLFTLTLGTFILLATIWLVDRRLLIPLALFAGLAGLALVATPDYRGTVVSQGTSGWEPVVDASGQPQTAPLPLVTEQQALDIRNQGDDLLISEENGREGYLSKLKKVLFGDPNNTVHSVNGVMVQRENGVFLHLSIALLAALTVLFFPAMIWLIWLRRGADGQSMWRRAVNRSQPRTLLPALDSLWSWHGLWALLLAFAIYALFFTSFGSHKSGVVSGITGSLLYWVGQHDVKRGGQPQHYYLVQLLVYEPLLLTAGLASIIGGIVHMIRQFWGGAAITARRLAPGLLAWWAAGSLALYTWAGEKMPWITLHVAIPLTLIGAWGVSQALQWAFAQSRERLAGMRGWRFSPAALRWFVGAMVMVAVFGVLRLAQLLNVTNAETAGSPATPALFGGMLALWLGLMVAYALVAGPRRMLGGALVAWALICGAYSLRSSWRLSYQNGDVPLEMMVYVQSSPDVVRVIRELETASVAETGSLKLPIMYDNETIWKWYVRNFEEKTEFGGSMGNPPGEAVQAILMISENWSSNEGFVQGFVEQRYPLRWWFPEDQFYRFGKQPVTDANGASVMGDDGEPVTQRVEFSADSTIGRFVRRPWDAKTLNELSRYMLFRVPPAPLSSVDFKLYVRPKYAHVFGLATTAAPANPAVR
ncbi:MAG TPA: flippase activity-associated protein Agl23 [Herpetosiphonaceae bacterium]